MTDIWTKAKRSDVMSRIRGSGNKDTELKLMAVFRLHGVTGWRRKAPVFGKPDFVFPQSKLAVFVDGCFWHGCPIHAAQEQRGVLADQDRPKPSPRPSRQPHPPPRRLARPPHLGP